MARVNVFTPAIGRTRFSGGLLTVLHYANGLVERGHRVTVVPLGPSPRPEWFAPRFEIFAGHRRARLGALVQAGLARRRAVFGAELSRLLAQAAGRAGYAFRRAAALESLRGVVPPADVTLATSFDTALPVHLLGSGRKLYFAQHYEPFFAGESDFPALAETDALASYGYPGLSVIANSSWLAAELKTRHGIDAPVCVNAIDQGAFFPEGQPPDPAERFVVISYGGRDARWKGFAEAAEAVRTARASIPNLEWRVYGDALMPPDNAVAPYVPLGFITGAALRRAYSAAHALLASSWYESFPLFPLEAMACGAAVVTTPLGTEDYAHHGENALVVPAREPAAMAAALVSLHRDETLRRTLVAAGLETARRFTWERSVARMAELLGI